MESGSFEFIRDVCCGTVGGATAKIIEYPLDTIKVRVQGENSPYKGYMDCAKRMLREEGFGSFYRGIGAPMAGAGLENAVCFGVNGRGLALYRAWNGHYTTEDTLPLYAHVLSGMMAGAAVSHVLTPVELLKCRMQLENMKPKEQQLYSGVWDCAKKSVAKEGIKGLFHGHTATLARETPGNGAWFGFYNVSVMAMTPAGQTKADLPGWKIALSGAIGGVAYWTAFFPADVVKTRMQTDPKYQGTSLGFGLKKLYREEGFKGLYKGWSITAVRAFPANAIIFFVVEELTKQWNGYFDMK